MVKTKHQKAKPKKQPEVKKHGKQVDISEFRAQLDVLGLKIIEVTADGNCFFRALADQLEGNEEEHEKYRSMVVQFIKNNREMFEPFIEDEVPFDEYCQSMEKDGTWAGHMELQAASLVTRSNICIHRHMSPRWYIKNFDNREVRMIHLSYHDGEHYNSVRAKDDSCIGPARPIIIKADADLSAASHQAKSTTTKFKGDSGKSTIVAGSIKMVIAGSGCEDAQKVEQVLQQVGGDTDAAIEYLIAEKGSEDYLTMNGHHQDENIEQCQVEIEDKPCKLELSCNNVERTPNKESLHHDEKKIPRNKTCPCGSKKKYKSCCGTAAGKASARITVNHTVEHGKGQKNKRQGKKGGATNVVDSDRSDGGPPDLGALCI